jgi:hypothetical protein
MTMTKHLLCCLAFCGLAACASDSAHDPQAIHAECRLEMNAARTAVHLRDQGKTRQAMLNTLPPLDNDSSRLLRQMHAIVDESYRFPKLNDVVFAIYRYETCARQLQHQSSPALGSIYEKLLDCQARFGRQASHAAVACVRDSYPEHSRPSAGMGSAGTPE